MHYNPTKCHDLELATPKSCLHFHLLVQRSEVLRFCVKSVFGAPNSNYSGSLETRIFIYPLYSHQLN